MLCKAGSAAQNVCARRWAKGLGAFINLESTGASGPDVLFQHTGAWTLRAYARAVKHPHGSCLAQVPVPGTGSSKVTDLGARFDTDPREAARGRARGQAPARLLPRSGACSRHQILISDE